VYTARLPHYWSIVVGLTKRLFLQIKRCGALSRSLEIIGEATKRVPDE
jgi:uncharacterized protein with HEPN domain